MAAAPVVPVLAASSFESAVSIAAVVAAIGSLAVLIALVVRRSRPQHGEGLIASSIRSPLATITPSEFVDHLHHAEPADHAGSLAPTAATNGLAASGIAAPVVGLFSSPPSQPSAPSPGPAHRPIVPASGPHASGLGAVELAAMVEEGLVELVTEVSEIESVLALIVERSSLPDDLPDRPAVEQRHLAGELETQVSGYLAHLVPAVEQVADDLGRADRALMEVRAELVRIGLQPDFFARMDAGATTLALRIPELRVPASILARRFGALSSLFSTLRPVHEQIENVVASLERANHTTAPWRGEAAVDIDLRDPVRPHPATLQ